MIETRGRADEPTRSMPVRWRGLLLAVAVAALAAACSTGSSTSQATRSAGDVTDAASSGALRAELTVGDTTVEVDLPPGDDAPPPPDDSGGDDGPGTEDGTSSDQEDADPPAPRVDTPPADADESPYAPVNRPGPELQVPRADLDASLRCPAALASVDQPVVLMIPGTTVTPQEAFEWNYARAFDAEGIPYCMVTVPQHADGDIQIAAEYVVDAVRTIHRSTDQKVILLGWSQGASTLPRWAIRFWPDIRPMISDLVGLAPLNNEGSVVANAICLLGSCIPAGWQQSRGSAFMDALNSRQQTFDGIDYTVIYSRTDDVVFPDVDGRLSVLPEGPNVTNVALTDVCPGDVSEHLLIVASPAAWTVAIDAIRHAGPADLSRLDPPELCAPGLMPEVSPIDLLLQEARIVANVGVRLQQGQVPAEPPLADYVFVG